ncbi:hypothetical protein ABBQ38_001146 [Trebouxia sp. C0009 RCD-2024]
MWVGAGQEAGMSSVPHSAKAGVDTNTGLLMSARDKAVDLSDCAAAGMASSSAPGSKLAELEEELKGLKAQKTAELRKTKGTRDHELLAELNKDLDRAQAAVTALSSGPPTPPPSYDKVMTAILQELKFLHMQSASQARYNADEVNKNLSSLSIKGKGRGIGFGSIKHWLKEDNPMLHQQLFELQDQVENAIASGGQHVDIAEVFSFMFPQQFVWVTTGVRALFYKFTGTIWERHEDDAGVYKLLDTPVCPGHSLTRNSFMQD